MEDFVVNNTYVNVVHYIRDHRDGLFEALKYACLHDKNDTVEHLLSNFELERNFTNFKLIIYCKSILTIELILLHYNYMFPTNGSRYLLHINDKDIMTFLLTNDFIDNVDPSFDNNKLLIKFTKENNDEMVKILLLYGNIEPLYDNRFKSILDTPFMISYYNYNFNILEMFILYMNKNKFHFYDILHNACFKEKLKKELMDIINDVLIRHCSRQKGIKDKIIMYLDEHPNEDITSLMKNIKNQIDYSNYEFDSYENIESEIRAFIISYRQLMCSHGRYHIP